MGRSARKPAASFARTPGRPYELAVACDTANLIDADAALALSRAAARTLMALSPSSAHLMVSFVEDEIFRLAMECSDESEASIALIREALRGG